MKRIIIPAGTVSGKKDYILEIPVDAYDDENAIYILDDKSSKGSVKSLSDYFYDKDSRSQLSSDYSKQYLYQQNQEQQNAQMYTDHSRNNLQTTYPSNYMLSQEYSTGNYNQVENPNIDNPSDISQRAKYYYYKSLGFTDSELHKLLAKNTGQRRIANEPSQRKQMRFNRMGVADFSSLYEDPTPNLYQYDSFSTPMNTATENPYVSAYNNMMSNSTYSNDSYNATTNMDINQGYYGDYPNGKQSNVPNFDARMYKNYDRPTTRAPVPSMKNNAVRSKQSYTSQDHSAAIPVDTKQAQNAYYQKRYYSKPVAKPKAAIPSKTAVVQNPGRKQSDQIDKTESQDKTYENKAGAISPDASISSNTQVENHQELPRRYPGQMVHPQKRTYRTIPGTSVVSNVQSIRLRRNPVAS